ncbi:MAG: hypothetical protein SCH70_07150 [Candidatus Methanoperedens sp.]|nr:hypothetical protein [Candidatus Methanoperedens sp.]
MEQGVNPGKENLKIPDITRLFKGPGNEFEVEVVFGEIGNRSPRESHPFDEIIVVAAGSIKLERSDEEKISSYRSPGFVVIPPGVEHVIEPVETPTRLVIIHPERQ